MLLATFFFKRDLWKHHDGYPDDKFIRLQGEACKDAGMNDFIAKPIRKTFLMQEILRALQQGDLSDGATAPEPDASDAEKKDNGVFDLTMFQALASEIDRVGAMEAFDVFDIDTRRRLRSFSEAEIDENRTAVQLEAHSLKSTAAMFGFQRLAALARDLEQRAQTVTGPEFRVLVPQMQWAFDLGMTQFRNTRLA
jgi:Hpt domain